MENDLLITLVKSEQVEVSSDIFKLSSSTNEIKVDIQSNDVVCSTPKKTLKNYLQNNDTINDILQKKNISDEEKYLILTFDYSHSHSHLDSIPFSTRIKMGNIERNYLSKKILDKYKWLIYSEKLKGIICKFCWIFNQEDGRTDLKALKKLVHEPITSYARLTGKANQLQHHDNHYFHKNSIVIASNFIKNFINLKENIDSELNLDEVYKNIGIDKDLVTDIETRNASRVIENEECKEEFGRQKRELVRHSFSSFSNTINCGKEEENCLKEIIMKNVGCDKLSSCLELCGCNTSFDLRSLNESNISDIEKYVSVTCQSMEKEKRTKYMREEFVNNPEKFMLSPIIKNRFFAALKNIADDLDKSIIDKELPEEVTENILALPQNNTVNESTESFVKEIKNLRKINDSNRKSEENIEIESSNYSEDKNSPTQVIYKNRVLHNITECKDSLYEFIIKESEMMFKDCKLIRNTHFTVYNDQKEPENGYFWCKLCPNVKKMKVILFKCYKTGRIFYQVIKQHLKQHFQLEEDTNINILKRKASVSDIIQIKRQRMNHSNVDKISNSSSKKKEIIPYKINVDAIKIEPSFPAITSDEGALTYKGELLEELTECTDQYYEYVTKTAGINFKNCNLVKNKHFTMYKDNKDSSSGYFCCKMCNNRPSSETKNKILKFNILRNYRISFWSLKCHLSMHFEKIDEEDSNSLEEKGSEEDESFKDIEESDDEEYSLMSQKSHKIKKTERKK